MALSTVTSWAVPAVSTIAAWAGSSVVDNLVSTAFSYFLERILPADREDELKRLERLQEALPQIRAVMGIAEALKMKDPDTSEWVEQFRQAVEASEEVLDELEYKKLEDMVKQRDEAGGSASSSKKKKSCTISDDTLERLKEAVKMLDQVAAGVDRLLQLAIALGIHGLSESRQEANEVLNRKTTSFLAEREVFGREVQKDKIIGWLKQTTDARLSSFGIYGVGGQGKTTLVQFAYQEMHGSNHFDKSIWVCVSTNFSVQDITIKILGELGENSCFGKTLNAVQETLKKKIHSKKVLLVLDDVWDDKRMEWEQLIAPLRFVQQGSKILFTTRMKSVADLLASVISTEHESLDLQGLEEQELRLLFYSYAFNGSNPDNHRDLQIFGDQILKMLRGSPLAAKVIGSLLNSNMDHNHWRTISNGNSIFNLEQAKDVVEVLKLSYYNLPANLQVCFKFCSIFPQDHLFDKDDLIEMWIAVGIIPQQPCQGKQPEDIGQEYFNHLLRKSFFEYVEDKRSYVMHDLLHELAQKVSYGECCRIESNENSITIPSTVRHVYVHDSEIEKVFHLQNLRSLVITTSWNLFVLPNNLIKKSLRLLKIIGDCELHKEISCLVHLRYLSIGYNYIFPSFEYSNLALFYKYYHLRVLELSLYGSHYSGLETTGMTNLIKLCHMRLPKIVVQTIYGIHKLTSLKELTFVVGQEVGYRINELGTLNNLRHLSIEKIENIRSLTEAKSANLLRKDNLISLSLEWTSDSKPDNSEQIIDSLQPHPNLMELTIYNYKGSRSPSWLKESLPLKLSSLKLICCPIWKNQLFSWQMPYLKILDIRNCLNLDTLPNMSLSLIEFRVCNVGLTSLPDLYRSFDNNTPPPLSLKSALRLVMIERCPNLISLNGFMQQDNVDLEAIEKLTIHFCEKLELVPVSAFGKLFSLKHLSIRDCQNLTTCSSLPLYLNEFYIDNVGVSALPKYYQSSDSRGDPSTSLLREVIIRNCQKLTALNGFLQQNNIDFQSIEEIVVKNCMNLVHPPIGAFWKFVSLLKLSITECEMLTTFSNIPLSLTKFNIENVGVGALPKYYQSADSRGSLSASSLKSSLREVMIRKCQKLTALNGFLQQDNIDIQSIVEIIVWSCHNLVHPPIGGFEKFVSLKKLSITYCGKLTTFPSLPLSLTEFYITRLGVSDLPKYYQVSDSRGSPSTSTLKSSLRVVEISGCHKLTALNGFLQQDNIDFQSIESITVYHCMNLVHPPIGAFGKFVSLLKLHISNCPMLVAVDKQSNLLPMKLKHLGMTTCGDLDVPLLESASRLTTLTDLLIGNCANISLIPSTENAFGSLNELNIWGCKKLVEHSLREQAHGVSQGSNLVSLKLSHLKIDHISLLLIEPLRSLRSVSFLQVGNCSGMEALPEQWLLQNSSTLRKLLIWDASSLTTLPATMARLTVLEVLEIYELDLQVEIPELPASLIEQEIKRRAPSPSPSPSQSPPPSPSPSPSSFQDPDQNQ